MAALAVAITHATASLRVDGLPAFWLVPFADQSGPARFLTVLLVILNAGGAVVLFFVLSGYVLALSLSRPNVPAFARIASYFIRRTFRILPALWISVVVFTIVLNCLRPSDLAPFSDWFTASFAVPPSIVDAIRNLFLVDFRANTATWTMYVEVIGSVALPVMLYITYHQSYMIVSLLTGAAILVGFGLYPNMISTYIFCFQIGVMVARYPQMISAIRRPGVALALGLGTSCCCRLWLVGSGFLEVLTNTIASCFILGAILRGGRATSLLEMRPLAFFGKISYSLYLIHGLIIYMVALVLAPYLASGVVVNLGASVLALAISVAAAAAMYRYVEQPMIQAGRRLSAAMDITPGRRKILAHPTE